MKVKRNVGTTDLIIRVMIGVTLISLYFLAITEGWWGIVLLMFGCTIMITGFIGFCPLYPLFGINTCKTKPENL